MNTLTANSDAAPRVWVLTGHKAGDNHQVTALAEALGWPYEVKHFDYRPWELVTNRLLGVTLAGTNRQTSSALGPPWPDLVITAGRRNEPVARWIKRQSPAARLVHVGRPWSPLAVFDLIVTTPQYFLPEQTNILHNHLPLHRVSAQRLNEAADHWRAHFAALPRPWISVLIGGNSGPFVFTENKGQRFGRLANDLAEAEGGSLLVSNSARTPELFYDAFLHQLRVPYYHHSWQPGQPENPYLGYLGLADEFVVTGESMSMLTEAAYTGKPLYIFDPADEHAWWRCRHNYRFKPLTHKLAMCLAPRRMHRDVGNIQRQLVDDGRAVWLGQRFNATAQQPLPDDVERTVRRVIDLLP